MSRNSTHINCNQIAGTVNQGIWRNDCDPCASSAHLIPNIQHWLRQKFNVTAGGTAYALPANTATIANGTAVSQWDDEIGTNNGVQATGANQPLWNSADSAMLFDGTNDKLTFTNVNYAVGQDFTILLGFIPVTPGTFSTHALWSGANNDSVTITSSTTIDVKFNNVTQTITGPTLSPQSGLTPPCEMLNVTLRRENDVCQLFIGGLVWGPTFIATGDYDINTIGNDGTNSLDGKVSTFMQFDRALTDKEIWCLDCYLCQGDDEPEPAGCRIDQFKLACHGDANGTLTANFTGAAAGSTITYLWSTGAVSQTISSLTAGSYTCVLTSDNNTGSDPADDVVSTCVGIVEGPLAPLSCAVTAIDPVYGTGGTLIPGSVLVTTSGGWGNQLSYAWTVPGGAAAIGDVATSAVSVPGTYTVIVTDSDSCTTTCNIVVNLVTPDSLDIECCINEAPCKDDKVNWHILMDASATYPVTISASGSITGVPAWSGGATVVVAAHPGNSTPTCGNPNVAAGAWFSCPSATEQLTPGESWSLTVTDAGVGAAQRTQTCQSTVVNPTEVTIIETVNQPTYCSAGGSDGTVTFNGAGGTAPYTYTITNSTTSAVTTGNALSGLVSGQYVLSATDANGCNVTKNIDIVCPMDPMPTITHVTTDPLCYNERDGGSCDGTIVLTPSVATFTGYTFTLTIYNQAGTAIDTTGPIATFPSPYTFGGSAGNMCAGNYTYTYQATNTTTTVVTDIALNVPFTLTNPSELICNHVFTEISCIGNDGTATASATGGTPAYTYAWTGPGGFSATTATITGISTGGIYQYVITDANGCTCTDNITFKEHCTFDATLSAQPIECASNGSATEHVINGGFNLNSLGGTATTWVGDTQTMNSIGATNTFFDPNNYTMSVALLNGPMSGQWNLFGPQTWPTVTPGNPNQLCFLPGQGMIQGLNGLTVGGVTYTYSISIDAASFTAGDSWEIKVYNDNGTSWVSQALTGTTTITTAGTHTATFIATTTNPVISVEYSGVAGAGTTTTWERLWHNTSGEKITAGYNGGSPALTGKGVAMSADGMKFMIGKPGNQGGKGTVSTFRVCNGGASYPYAGGGYAGSQSIHGVDSGDALGDRETISISHDGLTCVIGSPFTDDGSDNNCGSVTAYSYSETNAGSCYGIWETKGNTILDPGSAGGGPADDNHFGSSVALSGDGLVMVIGAKGESNNGGAIYVYAWNSGTSDWVMRDGPAVFAWPSNSGSDNYGYSVAINDDGSRIVFGAPGQDGTSMSSPDAGAVRVMEWNGSVYAIKGAELDGEFTQDFAGTAVAMSGDGLSFIWGAEKNDAGGSNVQKGHARVYAWDGSAWAQKGQDLDGVEDFGYAGWAVDINTAGTVVAVSAAKTDTDEFGTTGQVDAGSVKIYEYDSGTSLWVQIGNEIKGQNAGDYFGFDVMLNGVGDMVVIGAPFNNGDVPGSAIAGNQGAGYIYERVDVSNGVSGNGCITNISLVGQIQASNTTDIVVSTNTPCGTSPLTYLWTTPTATPQGSLGANANSVDELVNIGPGTYQVVVTDANGCTDTEIITIAEAGSVNNSITVTSNVTCNGTGGILTSGTPTGGTAPYSYYWTVDALGTIPVTGTTNGPNAVEIDNLAAGTYYLFIVDDNGCTWEGSGVVAGGSSGMSLSAVIVDEDLCGDCCGSIDLTVSGGTGPYTYYWTGLGGPYTTEDLSCVGAGAYTVIVTDDAGCTETATYTVGVSNFPINFLLQTNPTANTISVTGLSGGTPIYSYQWTLNGVNVAAGTVSSVIPDFTPTQSGLWCLTVTDSFLPDACSVTQCIDVNWVDPVLGYDCIQNYEDTCVMSPVTLILGKQQNEESGLAHAISGDGTTVVIGAPYHDCGNGPVDQDGINSEEQREYYSAKSVGNSDCGAVRVYTIDANNVHTQKGQTLFGSGSSSHFGMTVDIDADGNSIVVGAPNHLSGAGATYYFKYDGANWIQTWAFGGDGSNQRWGQSASLSGDGLHIALTAPSTNGSEGAARVYKSTDGGNTFTQVGSQITASVPAVLGDVGNAIGTIAINDAGDIVVIGTPARNFSTGGFGVYKYVGSAWVAWGAFNTTALAGEMTGHSVSINAAGDIIAIGSPGGDGKATNSNVGHVRVYQDAGSGVWNKIGSDILGTTANDFLTNQNISVGATGVELNAAGDILVVGSRQNDNGPNGIDSGRMRSFRFIDGAWVVVCDFVYGLEKGCMFGVSVDINDAGTRISGGAHRATVYGPTMTNAGHVNIKDMVLTAGTTTDHITDGTNFSTTFGAAQVGDFATAIAALDALPMVAGTWYPFAPTGVSAPTAVAGSIALEQQKGIVQKVTGLTIGHIYDIKVNASTNYPACSSTFQTGVASIKVYNGTTAATLESNSNGGFDGTGDTTVQYKATATTATIMILDNGNQLSQPCSLEVENLTMKRAQYSCEECKQAPCDFATMQLCLDEPCGGGSTPIAESYDCISGQCVDPGNGTGEYASEALCNAAGCGQRSMRYNCGASGCYEAAYGTYADQATCEAACGVAGQNAEKFYCEILCPDANTAEKYKDDQSVEEEGRYKGERKRETVTGGGKCRIVTGAESPEIPANLQYDDEKQCLENCPWCKTGDERL